MGGPHPEVDRLIGVMHELRARCPWDAEQTHRSLVTYLVEETAEVVEAIEDPDHDDHLVEELGDLLLQVLFHSEIAAEEGRFDIDDVARGIADKLIARHPYVFGDGEAPDDLNASWEQNKQREKGRRSPIEGIPRPLDTLARAGKVVSRGRAHGVPLDLSDAAVTAAQVGEGVLALVSRAQASGVDADQATRDALRRLEAHLDG